MQPRIAKPIVALLLAVGVPQVAGAAAGQLMPLGLGKSLDFGAYTLIFGLASIGLNAVIRGERTYRAAMREYRAHTHGGGHE